MPPRPHPLLSSGCVDDTLYTVDNIDSVGKSGVSRVMYIVIMLCILISCWCMSIIQCEGGGGRAAGQEPYFHPGTKTQPSCSRQRFPVWRLSCSPSLVLKIHVMCRMLGKKKIFNPQYLLLIISSKEKDLLIKA